MYTEIGSFEAKAKLSELLRQIKNGQRYTITLRGQPVADLIPSGSVPNQDASKAIEAMRAMPKVRGVSAKTVAEWVTKGRK